MDARFWNPDQHPIVAPASDQPGPAKSWYKCFSGPIEYGILALWLILLYLMFFKWQASSLWLIAVVGTLFVFLSGALRAKFGHDNPDQAAGITRRGRIATLTFVLFCLGLFYLIHWIWKPQGWVALLIWFTFSRLDPAPIFWKSKAPEPEIPQPAAPKQIV
jgi:hypothetical protein